MKKDKELIIVNYCVFFGTSFLNISEKEFLECIQQIKGYEIIKLNSQIKKITTKDFFELIIIYLPNELINKVDEILLFNSLSFTKKIIFKINKFIKNGI